GLIWTPCAGPILAAVLVQVIRQETDSQALLMILAFAIGAGIPMFIIAITGRKIMSKLGFFTAHAEAVRKVFAVIILIAVACIATGVNADNLFSKSNAVTVQSNSLQDGLETPYPAPEFAGIEAWLNANPLTMQSLKGKVVLIDFWTYSCINCVRTLPYITKWDEQYRDQGLVIIGVHAPEFEFEKNKDNVAAAIAAHNIKYPVALDNRLDTWQNFKNRYWPAHYLIDKDGKIVYTHFGEGKYDITENNIRYLLGLTGKTAAEAETRKSTFAQTPETYLGYSRSQNFADPASIKQDAIALYKQAKFLPSDHWGLVGKWQVEGERIVSGEADAALQINFTAKKVFLVLGTKDNKPINVDLSLNGEKLKSINVDRHNLYELVNQDTAKNALLEIKASKPGLEAYAFTFGN
ncbi:MAG: redoxin family protein, partial [Pseudomonadota bacterium]